jgi:hypothetical protein
VDGAHDEEILRILQGGVNWRVLLALAQREKAELILWRRLRALGWAVEGEIGAALARMAQVWEFKLVRLEGLFRTTLDSFSGAGIDTVLLKGSGTAFTAFTGFTDRPMFDVDILVRPDDAEAAWDLAQEHGWRWNSEAYPKDSYQAAHHFPPLDDESGSDVGLDLHTSLWMEGHPFRFSEEDIWTGARLFPVPGVDGGALVPSTAHQLIYACLHFSWSHGLEKYAWQGFREIGAISRQKDMSWDEVRALSLEIGGRELVYWPLRLGLAACGLNVPREVLAALRPERSPVVLGVLERHFLASYSRPGTPSPSDAFSRKVRMYALGTPARRGRVLLPGDHKPAPIASRLGNQIRSLREWVRYLGGVFRS